MVAQRYLARLSELPELELPRSGPDREPVWHLFVVRHPDRDGLRAALAAAGVGTGIHYPAPPHRTGAYAGSPLSELSLPRSEAICHEVLSLPMGLHVTPGDTDRVVEAVAAFSRASTVNP